MADTSLCNRIVLDGCAQLCAFLPVHVPAVEIHIFHAHVYRGRDRIIPGPRLIAGSCAEQGHDLAGGERMSRDWATMEVESIRPQEDGGEKGKASLERGGLQWTDSAIFSRSPQERFDLIDPIPRTKASSHGGFVPRVRAMSIINFNDPQGRFWRMTNGGTSLEVLSSGRTCCNIMFGKPRFRRRISPAFIVQGCLVKRFRRE